ncbi:TonB-dependent receptor plug domain-containing protein [Fulvivirga ligni]|uniref:TonB-dependent receptor plug domain-containing protein n=1 Tax=Fulvivirga ligni TaxID=2904246 RepID=UPI001F3C338C|nr:TonB-dependent receptor [Fulvivirga ligni]UII19672.1 TonB-dependent receptor [Fulvivirga ligni]
MKQLVIIYIIFITGQLYGQSSVTILDKDTHLPIEGAQIRFIAGSNFENGISDAEGQVYTHLTPSFTIQISHVEYKGLETTISEINTTIYLEPNTTLLNPVVITSQYNPQSAKNSVYMVKSISADRIQKQAAVTIQEVLKNEVNIQFSRDNAVGTSDISLLGLPGQYVKILIDGVPMAGRSGVNNAIDLNQLNINNIQQIEIIEGPMAVNYGADALAGVINIITKKEISPQWKLNLKLHEETVENSYSILDEGIHAPAATFAYQATDKWFFQGEGRYNKFGGWIGDLENYDDRNRQWYPKEQYNLGGLARYSSEGFELYYRTNYLHETIENLGTPSTGLYDAKANDEEYITTRWNHQLQSEITWGKLKLQPVLSYTDYLRITDAYTLNLVTNDRATTKQDSVSFKTIFHRNTLNGIKWAWGSAEIGFDSNHETASSTKLSDGDKSATDLNLFISAEIKAGEKLLIKPGIRYGYHSIYKTAPSPAVNFKYHISDNSQVRLGYGRGFRAPSLRELYHEFIDTNHRIIGNEELEPEYSHQVNADYTQFLFNQRVKTTVSGFYNYIKNRIGYITPQENNPDQATTYQNISEYKTTGGSFSTQWQHSNLSVSAGFSYIGTYQNLNLSYDVPQFLFGTQLTGSFEYRLPKPELSFSLFYNYNGKSKGYNLVEEGEEMVPRLQSRDAYHFLDLTVAKPINAWASVSVGSKNLLNVTTVNNNLNSGGAHSSSTGQTSIGYGRSYFIQMNFNLQSNK